MYTCDREAATTRGCHLGYTDTLTFKIVQLNCCITLVLTYIDSTVYMCIINCNLYLIFSDQHYNSTIHHYTRFPIIP